METIIYVAILNLFVRASLCMEETDKKEPIRCQTEPCLTEGIVEVRVQRSLENCAYECLMRSGCFGFSFHRQMSLCFLIDYHFKKLYTIKDNGIRCINLNVIDIPKGIRAKSGICAEKPCSNSSQCVLNRSHPAKYDCIVHACSSEVENSNTLLLSSMKGVGHRNVLKCRAGYTAFGDASVQCVEGGVWSSSSFECYLNCPKPEMVNADVTEWNPRLAYGTIAVFKCHLGYYNITPLAISCNESGHWSEAKCYKHCLQPSSIGQATYLGQIFSYDINTTIEYTCNAGYYNITPLRVTCSVNGVWVQENTIFCNKHCPDPGIIGNAIYTDTNIPYVMNTTIEYACNIGYYNITPLKSSCNANGEWIQENSLNCYKYCSNPVSVGNAKYMGNLIHFVMDTVIEYTCITGYYNITPLQLSCNANGDWIEDTAISCLKYCSTPPDLANAIFTTDSSQNVISTTVMYACNDGYYPDDSSQYTITCLEGGVWSTLDARCNKYCYTLPSPVNAELIEVSEPPHSTGSTAEYECHVLTSDTRGLESKTSEVFHCNENGDWFGSLACCGWGSSWFVSKGKCCISVFGAVLCP